MFLSFDGSFGTRAVLLVGVPQGGVSRDGGAQAGVVLWIGIHGTSIGGGGASFRQRTGLGRGAGERWASPFDAYSVGTVSPGTEGESSRAEGMSVWVEGKGRRIGEVSQVAFVEGDDEAQVPVGLQQIVS